MADGGSVATIRTALYRHFDATGKLLYVGISLSPTYRLSQHADASRWFDRIESIKIEWHDSRDAALAAERRAIQSEGPEFNIIHRARQDARAAYLEELAAESCAELTRKVTRFQPTYKIQEAANAVGIGPIAMRLAVQYGDVAHFMVGDRPIITGWALIAYMEALQAGLLQVRKAPPRNPWGPDGRPDETAPPAPPFSAPTA